MPNNNQGDAYPVIQHGFLLPHFASPLTRRTPCFGVFHPVSLSNFSSCNSFIWNTMRHYECSPERIMSPLL